MEHLERNGFGRSSLREIAGGVGTSHRMLIYHFGSREGLLTEVVRRVEAQQRAALAELTSLRGADPAEICHAFWRRISDPAVAPASRLFFEVYAQALYGDAWAESFRSSVISSWERPLTDLFQQPGVSRAQASRRARLAIAVARGLLLDLLLTGERRAVSACADEFARLVVDAG